MIIAIDIGTTNLKIGLYQEDGNEKASTVIPMKQEMDKEGICYFNPEVLWKHITNQIRNLMKEVPGSVVSAISITSMAESGLLLHIKTGKPYTKIIPWFETSSSAQANFIKEELDSFEQFSKTGLYASYKQGLSKLLWLKERDPDLLDENLVWLSVSAYIAYCLTNRIAEERSLAVRTFAYNIREQEWDTSLMKDFGLRPDLFPPVQACTTPIGTVSVDVEQLGINRGTKVYIAGHDHLAASLSIGEISPENIYNSMGTAETLMGTFPKRELTREDAASGLTFGMHPMKDTYYWMGGHSSSGGSVEWLRSIISDRTLTYDEVNRLLEQTQSGPSGIIYFPYLNGSGAPHPDPEAEAAFIGLSKRHGKKELLKAVLEGNAFQMELIKEAAQQITKSKIRKLTVVGGGVKNKRWIQTKANISGISLDLPVVSESASKGAALVAATGEGVYPSLHEAVVKSAPEQIHTVHPDMDDYYLYQDIYQNRFKVLRQMVVGKSYR